MTSNNTAQLRINNRRNVYKFILKNKLCSKQDIALGLGVSLPTVTQAINELLSYGFVKSSGLLESTGGRKAMVFEGIADAKVAVGVQILTDDISIVLCDLRGEIVASRTVPIPFSDTPVYYETVGNEIQSFIETARAADIVLGVAITVQGIVDETRRKITYGRILNNSQITAEHFEQYMSFPCILMHDSEAAAFAESYLNPDIADSIYIFLNKNLGSGFIQNGKIYAGNHSRGTLVEHMCLVPHGKQCYCGKLGCSERYCSANALIELANSDLPTFFEALRQGSISAKETWNEYLSCLANTIYNVLMFQDVNIVIGGLVRKYMTVDDLDQLFAMITERSDFPIRKETIMFETSIKTPAAVGAALYHINSFLEQF